MDTAMAVDSSPNVATNHHQESPIKTLATELIATPHLHEGKEEEFQWKLIALELAARLRIAPGATAQTLPPQDVTKDLQKIKAALKELKTAATTALKAPQGPTNSRVAVPSYANITAKGATAPQPIQLPRTSEAPLRKGREIIVRIRD